MESPIVSERKTNKTEYYFGVGDFSHCYDKFEERYLSYDYKALTEIGQSAWNFVKNNKLEGYMMKKIRKECWQGHTDDTFLKSMTTMKCITQIGWDKYANCVLAEFW